MEKKRVVPVWVSVVLLLLCAISIVRMVFMFYVSSELSFESQLQTIICIVICICTIVLALVYCFMGYKKNASKVFMAFSIALTLLVFVQTNHYMVATQNKPQVAIEEQYNEAIDETITDDSNDTVMPEPNNSDSTSTFQRITSFIGISDEIAPMILIFGILLTLTIAKDLGKKKSYWLIGIATALALISCIIGLNSINGNFGVFAIISASTIELTILILCVIYGIMIYAKYKDKEARGTK